jgi:hypothetical protein
MAAEETSYEVWCWTEIILDDVRWKTSAVLSTVLNILSVLHQQITHTLLQWFGIDFFLHWVTINIFITEKMVYIFKMPMYVTGGY